MLKDRTGGQKLGLLARRSAAAQGRFEIALVQIPPGQRVLDELGHPGQLGKGDSLHTLVPFGHLALHI